MLLCSAWASSVEGHMCMYNTYTCPCTWTCPCPWTWTCACTCVCACVCACVHVHVHVNAGWLELERVGKGAVRIAGSRCSYGQALVLSRTIVRGCHDGSCPCIARGVRLRAIKGLGQQSRQSPVFFFACMLSALWTIYCPLCTGLLVMLECCMTERERCLLG